MRPIAAAALSSPSVMRLIAFSAATRARFVVCDVAARRHWPLYATPTRTPHCADCNLLVLGLRPPTHSIIVNRCESRTCCGTLTCQCDKIDRLHTTAARWHARDLLAAC